MSRTASVRVSSRSYRMTVVPSPSAIWTLVSRDGHEQTSRSQTVQDGEEENNCACQWMHASIKRKVASTRRLAPESARHLGGTETDPMHRSFPIKYSEFHGVHLSYQTTAIRRT